MKRKSPTDQSLLSFRKETIRSLSHDELSEAAGGTSSTVCATIIIIVTKNCVTK